MIDCITYFGTGFQSSDRKPVNVFRRGQTVEVHYLGPRLDEGRDEFRLGIISRIGLGQGIALALEAL